MSAVPTRAALADVRYEIRGELARRARALEAEGREIIRLNIGNPGAFGFRAPEHLERALAARVVESEPYGPQAGLPAAREAVAAHHRATRGANADAADVFIGNGVSELIDLTLRALLNPGDEVLIPSPDYPLWTAATVLNDGRPRHYPCQAANGFLPDPAAVEGLVTPRTRALVIIHPNNPTGAVYPRELLAELVAVARRHGLLLLSDEIYDGILYDGAEFQPVAPLAGDLPCVSFGGLSKVHRACGWRVGWAVLSGAAGALVEYRHALDLLSALRLCANQPGQHAVEAALSGPDTIGPLCAPGGRLEKARRIVKARCEASPHLELVAPRGAMYAFPRVVGPAAAGFDDHDFALELLDREGVLIVPGSSFNLEDRTHLRLTLLPPPEALDEVFKRLDRVLDRRAASARPARQVA
jgi:alanine-synthesizing transaminase